MMLRAAQFLALVLVILVAASCTKDQKGNTQLLFTPPETSAQRIAFGYSAVTEVRLQAADLVKAKHLSVQHARQVQDACDTAREILDAAKQQLIDDPAGNQPKVEKLLSTFDSLLQIAQKAMYDNRRRP